MPSGSEHLSFAVHNACFVGNFVGASVPSHDTVSDRSGFHVNCIFDPYVSKSVPRHAFLRSSSVAPPAINVSTIL